MNIQPFNATQDATVNINVGNTTANVSLGGSSRGYRQVRILNDGTATVWITFGDSTVTATTSTGIPIRAGQYPEVLTIPNNVTHVAAIAAAATGIIYFTPGSGV